MILTDEEHDAIYAAHGGTQTRKQIARAIESAVINKLATVEGGPAGVIAPKVHGEDRYLVEWLLPVQRGDKLYTAVQLAAARAQDAAEIERLKEERDEWKNDALNGANASFLRGRVKEGEAERDALQARVAELEQAHSNHAEYPAKCPITRRDFFMVLDHPTLGMVPTYGGPYDSYTIPEMSGDPSKPHHERELFVHRYDHDEGCWVDDEFIGLRVINEDVLTEIETGASSVTEDELLDAAISWCDSNGINVLEPEQLSSLVNTLYVTVQDAAIDAARAKDAAEIERLEDERDALQAEIDRLKSHIKHIGNDALRRENAEKHGLALF